MANDSQWQSVGKCVGLVEIGRRCEEEEGQVFGRKAALFVESVPPPQPVQAQSARVSSLGVTQRHFLTTGPHNTVVRHLSLWLFTLMQVAGGPGCASVCPPSVYLADYNWA